MKHFEVGYEKPEIIIALAGPVGTDLNMLAKKVEGILTTYKYQSETIKVSNLIAEATEGKLSESISSSKGDTRIELLMNSGDALRQKYNKGDILVSFITASIRKYRKEKLLNYRYKEDDVENLELYNQCYIINSLKHPDEVKTLRKIYRDKFILISAFTDIETRIDNLCRIIAKSYNVTDDEKYRENSKKLIKLDSERANTSLGQSLTKTFHRGDFFLRTADNLETDLTRFFKIFFGCPFETPKRDEFFIFEAKSNSLRSADLSRQVGAIITNSNNDIVARGCNEVPVFKGGAYWPDNNISDDNRDYKQGRDFNAVKKHEILEELLEFLKEEGILITPSSESKNLNSSEIVNNLVYGKFNKKFSSLRVSNLIEFGRVVHAEMHALMEAARRGLSVQDGSLYCTTFPCHMCARHIIAAGILRVVYIEPYPKSMTKELYSESVTIDAKLLGSSQQGPSPIQKSVSFVPFEGIAPSVYQELFNFKKRKDDRGYTVEWEPRTAMPSLASLSTAHLILEVSYSNIIANYEKIGLNEINTDD